MRYLKLILAACLIFFISTVNAQSSSQKKDTLTARSDLAVGATPIKANFLNTSTMRGLPADWDLGYFKASCAENEALLGISQQTAINGAGRFALCEGTGLAAAPRTATLVNNGSSIRRIERHGDWASGYIKLECGKDQYAIGIGQSTTTQQKIHGLLCVTGPAGLDDGAITTPRQMDNGSSMGSNTYGDWDPDYFKAQCITGEHIVGVSIAPTGRLHSILCSGEPTLTSYFLGTDGILKSARSYDYGNTFEFSGYANPAPPSSITNFNGQMYFAYQDSNGTLCIRISDNRGNTVNGAVCQPQITMAGSPSIAAFNGRLYVVYKSGGTPSNLTLTATSDGSTFDTPTAFPALAISSDPAIAAFNGKLYAAYVSGTSRNTVCVASLLDDATPMQKCTDFETKLEKPGLTAAFGKLFVSFRDPSNKTSFIASGEPERLRFVKQISTTQPSDFLAQSPTAMNFMRDRIFVSFKGNDSKHWIIRSSDGVVFSKIQTPTSAYDIPSGTSAPSILVTQVSDTIPSLRFAAYGDMPYTDADKPDFFNRLLPTLASSTNIPFILHLGDLGRPNNGSGSVQFDSCSDAFRMSTLYSWDQLNRPLIFMAGDNDWTDCNRERAPSSKLDPLNDFKKIRAMFVAHSTLHPLEYANGSYAPDLDDGHIWIDRDIAYLSLNIVGSDNGIVPATYDAAIARNAEVAVRQANTLDWIDRVQAVLSTNPALNALVVTFHVDIFRGETAWDLTCDRTDPSGTLKPYKAICSKLFNLAASVKKPVLLVHGDTNAHCFWKYPNPNIRLWVLNGPGDFRGVDADLVSFDKSNVDMPFTAVGLLNSGGAVPNGQESCNYNQQ